MRSFKIGFLFLLLILFISCDPCKNLDCAYDDYYGNFRIVSTADGKDLVFGSNKIYNRNEIKFYTLNSRDTTFFELGAIKSIDFGNDSVLRVKFFPKADTAYMRVSNNDTDTLVLSYQYNNSRCCGTITEITNFRLNNKTDLPGNSNIQVIRK